MRENELIEQKELREQMIDRVEVLDKVGELLLLPNTEFATTEQVAEYFKVDVSTIRQITVRNNEEIVSDGYKSLTGKQLGDIKSLCQIKSRAKQLAVFPKRAILRVGMLLRDSEIAKEIRTRLLDIVQDVSEGKDNVIENIIDEISEEKQLMLDRVEAEMNGDYDTVCVINAKLFDLKNKRIKELENKIDTISTNALTITESRAVMNKLVRLIAIKEYKGLFGVAFAELYKQVNYKLGINIKGRNKKKSQTYLDTMTEQEVFDTEVIVRNWAEKVGIDVNKELNLAS